MSRRPVVETHLKSRAPKAAAKPAAPTRASAPGASGLLQRALDNPELLSAADVMALQRRLGNSAVQGILARHNGAETHTEAGAAVSAPQEKTAPPVAEVQRDADPATGEALEAEAQAGAASDMIYAASNPNPEGSDQPDDRAQPGTPVSPVDLQREAEPKNKDELSQTTDNVLIVGLAGGPVEAAVEQRISSERGQGQPLPEALQRKVEGALGADLSGVRVHTGSTADALNRSLSARAFATGSDIFFKDGEYNPNSSGGQALLAHELTHVVQQEPAVRRQSSAVRRRLGVPRAAGGVAQREVGAAVAGAYGNQRQEWKEMSTLGKIAMVPGGALYGAGQAAANTYGGVYSRLAGQSPGRLRQGAAVVGSAVLGTLALPFTATAGALRGAFQGIANPVHSLGKRIGGAAASVPARVRGAVGNYGPGLTREENLLGATTAELGSYGLSGVGTAATGARSALDIASRSESGDFLGHNILTGSQISGAGTAFGVLGGGAGALGAGAALAETYTSAREAAQGGLAGSTRALAVGQTLSSAGEALKQSSMSAYNIASLVDAQGVAAAGAQVVAAGASVAIGAIDMIRGGYGLFQGRKREQLLLEIARDADLASRQALGDVTQGIPTTPAMQAASGQWRLIATTARAAARTQATRQNTAGMTILKGAVAITGGALLLAATATPIGWALLAGAALIGGIAAAVRYFRRKKARRQTVIDGLPPDVKARRVEWKRKKEEVEHATWWGTNARREGMRGIGEDPLETWLRENGFRNVDHAYTKYINDTAQTLYDNAVENDHPEMIKLLKSIGLTVNKARREPKPPVIAAALDR